MTVSDFLTKLFCSRAQKLEEYTAEVFTSGIMTKNYSEEVFEIYLRDYIEDGSYKLTLPAILERLKECNNKVKQKYSLEYKVDCEYCDNSGFTHYVIQFDENGKYINSRHVVYRCRCGRSQNKSFPMVLKNKYNLKEGGYIRILTKTEYWDLMGFVEKYGKDVNNA